MPSKFNSDIEAIRPVPAPTPPPLTSSPIHPPNRSLKLLHLPRLDPVKEEEDYYYNDDNEEEEGEDEDEEEGNVNVNEEEYDNYTDGYSEEEPIHRMVKKEKEIFFDEDMDAYCKDEFGNFT